MFAQVKTMFAQVKSSCALKDQLLSCYDLGFQGKQF